MYTTLLFILSIAFILWGLFRTTEKVLDIREAQREQGKNPFLYL